MTQIDGGEDVFLKIERQHDAAIKGNEGECAEKKKSGTVKSYVKNSQPNPP